MKNRPRKKLITIILVVLTVIFSGTAVYFSTQINKRDNIGPTGSLAAEVGLPGVVASGWTKVQTVQEGQSLGVVQNKLIAIQTITKEGCKGDSAMYVTDNGTSWTRKDLGQVGCLRDFIDWDGRLAIAQYPTSNIVVADINGRYYPPVKTQNIENGVSFSHEWGDVSWRESTMLGTYDFSSNVTGTPSSNKVLFVDRCLGRSCPEADFIAFFPQKGNKIQRLNVRQAPNEFGAGVVVGDYLYIAENVFKGNGRLHRIAYKGTPTNVRVSNDYRNQLSLPDSMLPETPDANIRDVRYEPSTQRIYVSGYFQDGNTTVPMIYSVDLNGHVTGLVRGIGENGYQARNVTYFNGKLYVTLEGANGKRPGINVCNVNGTGDVQNCGFIEYFDGYKDLQVYNGYIYAIGPNGIYRRAATTTTTVPTASPTQPVTTTTVPTTTPTASPTTTRSTQVTSSPTVTPSPSVTSTSNPQSGSPTATPSPSPSVSPSASPLPSSTQNPNNDSGGNGGTGGTGGNGGNYDPEDLDPKSGGSNDDPTTGLPDAGLTTGSIGILLGAALILSSALIIRVRKSPRL